MCGTIDPGHTYDEYVILFAKLGMTKWYGFGLVFVETL
jgi:hypothetical protein